MSFASGKHAKGLCDVCGQVYKLSELKETTVRSRPTGFLSCPPCWDADNPQEELGKYRIHDPQALRRPRSDAAELAASRGMTTPVFPTPTTGWIGDVTVVTT